MTISNFSKCGLVTLVMICCACVLEPAYDQGPPPPSYGYYGYGPDYPWALGANVDIIGGYGHGGYGHGGYGGGGYGRGGGHSRGGRGGR